MLGAASYNQAFALLETTIVFGALLLLPTALPAAWYSDKFVALIGAVDRSLYRERRDPL